MAVNGSTSQDIPSTISVSTVLVLAALVFRAGRKRQCPVGATSPLSSESGHPCIGDIGSWFQPWLICPPDFAKRCRNVLSRTWSRTMDRKVCLHRIPDALGIGVFRRASASWQPLAVQTNRLLPKDRLPHRTKALGHATHCLEEHRDRRAGDP